MPAAHNILMLAFPNGQLLDIAGPLQMFAGANDALSRQVYRIEIAAPQAGPFPTSSGVRLVADVAFAQITNKRLARTHTLITVGGEPGMRQELARGSVTDIVSRAIDRVPRIASVCSGTFFLAAAGALDGRRVTTHWSEVDALKRFRPAVLVEGDAIHIEDRGIWTSAGVTAGMDLALAMIEVDLGREVALAIARRHVVFRIRPGGQSQFSAELAAQSAGNAKIQKLAERVTAHPRADWRTDVLAAEAGVSQRSLSRLFRAGLNISPTHTFADCPPLDLICIPGGGNGVVAAANDQETIDFVRRQASQAKYVTSVCTGAFILGVAGVLRGRRATTHWAFTELLPLVGATHEKARIVRDGNVITAGGVTSGIDFGLSVVAEIAGEQTAQAIQLGIEYDPTPPFSCGHPDRASAGLTQGLVASRYGKLTSAFRAGLEQIAPQ
jgi:cyclohexyl-isocyanide hydratase